MLRLVNQLRSSTSYNRLRVAWRQAFADIIVDGHARWGLVTGPISALIATLHHYGWTPAFVEVWACPDAKTYVTAEHAPSTLRDQVLTTVKKTTLDASRWALLR